MAGGNTSVQKGVSSCPCGLAIISTYLRISSSLTEMFLMLPDILMGASVSNPTLLKSTFPPEAYDIFWRQMSSPLSPLGQWVLISATRSTPNPLARPRMPFLDLLFNLFLAITLFTSHPSYPLASVCISPYLPRLCCLYAFVWILLLYRIALPSISLHSQCSLSILSTATACRSPETLHHNQCLYPMSYALAYKLATYLDCLCIVLDGVSLRLGLRYFCNDLLGLRKQWPLRKWNPLLTTEVNLFLLLKKEQITIPKYIITHAIVHDESS